MKSVKLYIDEDYIKTRLGEKYKDCNIVFVNSAIDNCNTLTFECLVTEESVSSRDIKRERM